MESIPEAGNDKKKKQGRFYRSAVKSPLDIFLDGDCLSEILTVDLVRIPDRG